MDVRLRMRDIHRYEVIKELQAGKMIREEAGEVLGLSKRQISRLKKKVKEKGIKGIIHGNRGRSSPNRIPRKTEKKVSELYKGKYREFNVRHFSEKLKGEEEIDISREKVRQILIKEKLHRPERGKKKHRSWRKPMKREGQMLQWDTSDHDWLEGRGERIYLICGVDDSTSKIVKAHFVRRDDVLNNMGLLKEVIEEEGIPLSIYWDRDSKFKTTRHRGIHYDVKGGKYKDTQITRAVKELGIEPKFAKSPQGKGRVERKFGFLQDRLCSEMRLRKISNIAQANNYLLEEFIPDYNERFSFKANEEGKAYREVPEETNLEDIFCIKRDRKVYADNTVSLDNQKYQIEKDEIRISYAKCKVRVYCHLDGKIDIWYKDRKLNSKKIEKRKKAKVGG